MLGQQRGSELLVFPCIVLISLGNTIGFFKVCNFCHASGFKGSCSTGKDADGIGVRKDGGSHGLKANAMIQVYS